MRALALAVVLLGAPAVAAPVAPAPSATPAAPVAGRWLIVDGTPTLLGGVGLEWRVTDAGGAERTVGLIGCLKPSGIYFGAEGIKPKPGQGTLTLRTGPAGFALQVLPKQEASALEAVGSKPEGFLDALGGAPSFQFQYGDQSSTPVIAPDPLVTSAFVSACRKIEAAEHGQGG